MRTTLEVSHSGLRMHDSVCYSGDTSLVAILFLAERSELRAYFTRGKCVSFIVPAAGTPLYARRHNLDMAQRTNLNLVIEHLAL